MTNLAPIAPTVPQWFIEIFTNKYSNEEAYPHPEDVDDNGDPVDVGDVDHDWDTRRAGWIRLGGKFRGFLDDGRAYVVGEIRLYDVNIKWDIHNKPTGELIVDTRDSWLLGLDMIEKAKALIYYSDGVLPDQNVFPNPSPVVFCIDSDGIEDCWPEGFVSVYGMLAQNNQPHTEEVRVSGDGIYRTANFFNSVYRFGANLSGDHNVDGGRASMSVWAKVSPSAGMRECRIWCDANEDGFYGCIFGGYIKGRYGEVSLDDLKVCFDLTGYAEAMQLNEYVAGYRAAYRCEYFNSDGQYGDCTNATYKDTCFRQGGSSCYVGDWSPAHPNGVMVTDDGYCCPGYSPNINEPLPYDGWTYDPKYAPEGSVGYEWYPPNYFRALQAACNMMNSLEEGKATSRPWSLPLAVQVELAEDLDETEDMVDLTWDRYGSLGRLHEKSEIDVEGEIMYVQVDGGGATIQGATIGVLRGAENTLQMTHPAGTKVNLPQIAWSPDGDSTPPLVRTKILCEPNLKNTVMDTVNSLAEMATSQMVNAPYVAWIDCFRQIQFIELDTDRFPVSGFDDFFEITPDDIIEDPTYCLTGTCNRICGQIDYADSSWIYAEMTTNHPGLEAYKDSTKLFGICTEEISDVHLTALKPTEGCIDFTTYATNFLKCHSYPRLVEHIAINGFIPDEHDWEWVSTIRTDQDDHRFDPYLRYTDPINRHINLLGVKVNAPDFWLGRGIDGYWIQSDFVVEEIRWISKVEGRREFITYLTISRPTLPEEWA